MFNEKAAQWARDLVMKMDPAEARVLVPMVMSDVLNEDIRNNKRAVNGLIARIHKSMVADVERQVSKGLIDGDAAADVLTEVMASMLVREDEPFDVVKYDRQWGYRDADGQFSSTDKLTGASRNSDAGYRKEVKQGAERFRQYAQYASGNRAAGDLISALEMNSSRPSAAGQAGRAMETQMPTFMSQWTKAGQDTKGSSNAETYRRIGAGSQMLSAAGAATNSQHAQVAGAMGQFAGQYGPEAEKIIGPSIRRAMYRYRGVEKKPDAELEDHIKATAQRLIPKSTTAPDGTVMNPEVSNERRMEVAHQATVGYMMQKRPSLRLAEIQRNSGRITPSEGVIINPRGEVVAQAFGHADDHYLPFNLKNLGDLNGGEYVRTRTMGGLTSEDIYTGLMAGAKRVTVVSNSGTFTVEFDDSIKGIKRHGDKARSMIGRYEKTLDTIRNGKLERVGVSPEVKAELLEEAEDEMPPSMFSRAQIQENYKAKIEDYKTSATLTRGEMADIDTKARASAKAAAKKGGDEDRIFRATRVTMIEDAERAKEERIYRLDGDGYSTALDAMKEQYPYFIDKVTFTSSTQGLKGNGDRVDLTRKPLDQKGAMRQEAHRNTASSLSRSQDAGYVKPKHVRPEAVLEGYYDPSIDGPSQDTGAVKGRATGKTRADRTDYQNWGHNPLNPDSDTYKKPEAPEAESEAAKKPQSAVRQAMTAQNVTGNLNDRASAAARTAGSGIGPMLVKGNEKALPLIAAAPAGIDAREEYFARLGSDPAQREALADEFDTVYSALPDSDPNKAKIREGSTALRGLAPLKNQWEGPQSLKEAAKGVVGFTGRGHEIGSTPEEMEWARKRADKSAAPLRQYFKDDAQALSFAANLAGGAGAFQAGSYGLDDATRDKLYADVARGGDAKFIAAGEALARVKHINYLQQMAGGGSPKAPAASASAAAPTTIAPKPSTEASSSTQSARATTSEKAKEVPDEQPHVIAQAPKKPSAEHALKQLEAMTGQSDIKREVRRLSAFIATQKQREELGLPHDKVGTHMLFTGNPGTGKTTVARMVGEIYAANGVIDSGHVVEVGRSGLVAGYQGQTAEKTMKAIDAARGGVLFIDEAYALAGDTYGQEAIETIMTEMENSTGDDAFVVIAAGYPDRMKEFVDSNPGLGSRFARTIAFQDYSPKEMTEIASKMATKRGYELGDGVGKDMAAMHKKRGKDFANGRSVRNYLDTAITNHAIAMLDADEVARRQQIHEDDGLEPEAAKKKVFSQLLPEDLPGYEKAKVKA